MSFGTIHHDVTPRATIECDFCGLRVARHRDGEDSTCTECHDGTRTDRIQARHQRTLRIERREREAG